MAWRRDSGSTSMWWVSSPREPSWEVVVLGGALRADVLPERPAERDVEHLRAAADREHRLVGLERPARQQHLGAIELGVDLDRAVGARLLAVQRRLDVGTAREAETVAEVEELAQRRLRRATR